MKEIAGLRRKREGSFRVLHLCKRSTVPGITTARRKKRVAMVAGDTHGRYIREKVVQKNLLGEKLNFFFSGLNDCRIKWVGQSRLEIGVQKSSIENFTGRLSCDPERLFQPCRSFGDCSGLVGTKYFHTSEVLYGVESFDDYAVSGHVLGSPRKGDTENDGKHFRR